MNALLPLGAVLLITSVVLVFLAARPDSTRVVGGKVLAFVGIFLLPVVSLAMGFTAHLDRAKTTEFCTSCHIMKPYGQSLLIDDDEYVPAVHYQNNLVDRDHACYTCHTDYALFGDVRSKIRGMRHLLVQMSGKLPEQIELYEPFHNRECLHCHGDGRRFTGRSAHNDPDTLMDSMLANRTSCMSSGCHQAIHDVADLEDLEFWKEGRR